MRSKEWTSAPNLARHLAGLYAQCQIYQFYSSLKLPDMTHGQAIPAKTCSSCPMARPGQRQRLSPPSRRTVRSRLGECIISDLLLHWRGPMHRLIGVLALQSKHSRKAPDLSIASGIVEMFSVAPLDGGLVKPDGDYRIGS